MSPAERETREAKRQALEAQTAQYHTLRAQLQAQDPGADDAELDELIVQTMSAFKICPTDVAVLEGQTHTQAVMARTSTETKIKALEALLS